MDHNHTNYREIFLKINPHYVIIHHFDRLRDLLRDLSGNNPENIPPLENDEYVQFMQDVNLAVRRGPLIVSIFTDGSGNGIALDTNGNPILHLWTFKTPILNVLKLL